MSPEAVTGRMLMLDQLWELAVAVKGSELGPRIESSPEQSVLAAKDRRQIGRVKLKKVETNIAST